MLSETRLIWARKIAKDLRLGVLLYKFYYSPKAFLNKLSKSGLINMLLENSGRFNMEQSAFQLASIKQEKAGTPLELHFLTGAKFWYQTCFCLYSISKHTTALVQPVIHDDGSLKEKYQYQIKRIFPNAKLILKEEIEQRIDEHLPQHKFPYLRERRLNYPNIRKLIDIHVGSQDWKLVLDSDMLFFRSPDFLLDWLQSPQQPCYMIDVESAYGYSDALMESLAKAKIPERVNVGICGLNSGEIDWEQVEHWCKTLIEQEGTHYYLEQAIVAMLMAGKSCAIASSKNYVVMPSKEEAMRPKAIMHHYVADSKSWYFRYSWRHLLQLN